MELLDSNGLKGSYDFIYVPHSFKRLPSLVNLGYFFVNFASHEDASRAWARLVGFKEWVKHSDKVMDASWATTTQGHKACVERFLNSRANNSTFVPLECKPMILEIASTQNTSQVTTAGDEATPLKRGDQVRAPTVETMKSAVENLRHATLDWNPMMEVVANSVCVVLTVDPSDSTTRVQSSDGKSWWLPTAILEKLEADADAMCRLNTIDYFDRCTGIDSDAEGSHYADKDIAGMTTGKASSGSPSTTDELGDSETGLTSTDATDEDASDSDMGPTCFNATTTWPVSRKLVRWCDVTGDQSDSESPESPRRQNNGLALTLLQSAFTEQGTEKSVRVKNTFIELDETPIAARRTRFASSFM